jgi:flavin reductase (DIM6/NTAB) family NADH-FMN oxidoreductase RutF
MKKKIDINEYAGKINEMLGKGILLNTNGDKFNSMVIGWGHLGRLWNQPTFLVYVRQSRYTKLQLDKTGEFSISVPLEGIDPKISRVCGSLSGYDVDKVKEAGLTLEDGEMVNVPGILEYPITLECKVIYAQDQNMDAIPAEEKARFYPETENGFDHHTMYVGRIVNAYMVTKE